MAIVLDEPTADACIAALEADEILISAGTVAEAAKRGRGADEPDRRARCGGRRRNLRWCRAGLRAVGKGVYPATLKFGDGFAKTDVKGVL